MSILERFLEGITSQHTRRAYRTDLHNFFGLEEDTELGKAQIASVSRTDVQAHAHSLQADDKSSSTLRRRLSALRRFFDWAVDEGLSDTNPARAARVDCSDSSDGNRQTDEDRSVLSKSDVEDLVRAADSAGAGALRNRGLLLTIFYGALRRSEVAAMDVRHVRPLGRHWVIDVPSGEGLSGGAYVKVPETVLEAIDAVQSRYGIDEGALWRSLSNRNRGARMTPDAIYKVVRRTGERAGLGTVTVETLRQTGLRLAMDAGASLQQAQLHGRLKSADSVERFADTEGRENRLSESVADFVELNA
jgi:integrase/recombinase XerD